MQDLRRNIKEIAAPIRTKELERFCELSRAVHHSQFLPAKPGEQEQV